MNTPDRRLAHDGEGPGAQPEHRRGYGGGYHRGHDARRGSRVTSQLPSSEIAPMAGT